MCVRRTMELTQFVKGALYEQLTHGQGGISWPKSHLKLVTPTTEKRTVTPTPPPQCGVADPRIPDRG